MGGGGLESMHGNECLHTFFQGFQLDFKLLFIVLFLGIISWKGASHFSGEGWFFRGGASFISGGALHGGHQF